MTGLRLYKKEKLRSLRAIDILFPHFRSDDRQCGTNSFIAYPWRVVWRVNDSRTLTCPQFLISVPKKRLRHAVDRVLMRRRMREAYRLNRQLIPTDIPVDMAFVYIAGCITPYANTERAVKKLFTKISSALSPNDPAQTDQ